MSIYSRSHLADPDLLHELETHLRQERISIADVLADLAEIDTRRLYLPAGYPSMYRYCVDRLRFAEDAAYRRIQVARVARRFPQIFPLMAEGRLHLTGVFLLASRLTPESADELLREAAGKSKAEIEQVLARRFPSTELLPMVERVPAPELPAPARVLIHKSLAPGGEGSASEDGGARSEAACDPAPAIPGAAPKHLENGAAGMARSWAERHGGGPASGTEPGRSPTPIPASAAQTTHAPPPDMRSRIAPIASERYALHVTIDKAAHDDLQYARALLGHAIPDGNLSLVLGRAFHVLVRHLERQKFMATQERRASPQEPRNQSSGTSVNPRYIPAHVKQAVWDRDGGQCTFVGASGHRCTSRTRLEYDHVEPVGRFGLPTVEGIRLRCRAHNQYEAERVYGPEFMARKREEARTRRDGASGEGVPDHPS